MKFNIMKNNKILLLSLDSTLSSVSASITEDGILKSFVLNNEKFGFSKNIINVTESALKKAGKNISELTHVAAGCGPGSFTGIRVCLSTAKGFVLSTGAQEFGVNILDAISNQISCKFSKISIVESKRNSVFLKTFDNIKMFESEIKEVIYGEVIEFIHGFCNSLEKDSKLVIAGSIPNEIKIKLEKEDKFLIKNISVNAKLISNYINSQLKLSKKGFKTTVLKEIKPIYITQPLVTKKAD